MEPTRSDFENLTVWAQAKGLNLDNALPLGVRQVSSIIFGVIEMFFFGGIIFGFNALTPILKKQNIYSYLCTGNLTFCAEQNIVFGYAFISYMAVQMVMLIVVGLLIDNIGLRVVKIGASFMFSTGAFIFAMTTSETSWLIFPAGCFLCVGGMACLICTFSISKLFTKTSVLVLALVTGSYDASSCVFAIFCLINDAGFSYQLLFYLLGGIGFILNIFSSLFITTYWMADMEKLQKRNSMFHIVTPIDEELTLKSLTSENEDNSPREAGDCRTVEQSTSDMINNMIATMYPTVWSSICSLPFLLITVFFCFAMLRFNFFLSQLGSLIQFHFNDNSVLEKLGRILSFALVGGFIAGPTCGFSIDYLRSIIQPKIAQVLAEMEMGKKNVNQSIHWLLFCPQGVTMVIVSITATILSCLVFIGFEYAYFINFGLLVILRGFLFSTISSFIMTGFPISQFGTLYGLCGAIAGAFSCIQYAMLQSHTTVANYIAFVFVPLMFCVPVFILFKCFLAWRKH